MAKKKLNEKEKDVQNSIENLIKESDECILITSNKGNIEVTGVKNINFSHQAKGLLHGALDSYSLRPILQTINALNRNITAHISNVLNIKKDK